MRVTARGIMAAAGVMVASLTPLHMDVELSPGVPDPATLAVPGPATLSLAVREACATTVDAAGWFVCMRGYYPSLCPSDNDPCTDALPLLGYCVYMHPN